ncbi:MAG: glycosyltransferase [Bacteroidia bacterium]|nr:glycosyltransferase [Bacteroidia bacterium]
MKTLLFIDSMTAGGAQRQMVGLARLLKSNEHQVTVATYFNVPFYEDFLKQNDIGYECIQNSENKLLRLFFVLKFFRKYRPGLVISYLDTPNILAILARFFGCHYKLIVSERNTTQKLTLREKVKFFLFRFADNIVPNSYSQARFIKSHYPHLAPKIETITNFVDTGFFKPAEIDNSGVPSKILMVGRIAPQKNVLKFIQAINAVVESGVKIQVDWYGNGNMNDGMSTEFSPYYLECIELIKTNKLENQFIFHQPVKDVRSVYQNCDVFCLPSIYEGFPNVICEAMACGKPILASNVCDNPNIVSDGFNGFLFNPESIDEMKQTIIKYSELSPETKIAMAQCSRDLAISNFSAAGFLSKYLKLIEKK